MKTIITYFFILFYSLAVQAKIEHLSAYSLEHKSLEELPLAQDKANVVIFLSKDCPCSKANLGYINELSEQFKGINFIGIHSKKGASPALVEEYFSDKKMRFPVFNDDQLKLADAFGALKTPHAFIVNSSGEIIYNGGITNTTNPINAKSFYLREALKEVSEHKSLTNHETHTLGCYIVR